MNMLRKIMLVVSSVTFAICGLFMNTVGGFSIISVNESYANIGYALIISTVILFLALLFAFFRNIFTNILSVFFNVIGSICYIYAIAVLNGIPNAAVPKEAVEILTSRIYPSIIVTVALATAVFADVMSYERSVKRAERKSKKLHEQNRSLTDEEKII